MEEVRECCGGEPVESSVYDRYAAAAQAVEPALCCPVEYSRDLLDIVPAEVIERDYGCGDPTPFVRPGDTVLDLGAGGGKLCFIAAQMVGPRGRVICVDCNQEMLALARKHRGTVVERLGYDNIEFRYGMIQDLQLDLELLNDELNLSPVCGSSDYLRLRNLEESLRTTKPLVASDSVDCVLSNCVLNLVRVPDRRQLFSEIYRVLRDGGRAAISDIVSDENVPEEMQRDPELWSGCLSGAFREDAFLRAFEEAGFHGIEIAKRVSEPWRTIRGIEFRSMTVVAYKGKEGPCLDRNQAIMYRGPFRQVVDDEGHVYHRGTRAAVCEKTFRLFMQAPYAGMFEPIEPRVPVSSEKAKPFDCSIGKIRSPRETKGRGYAASIELPTCGTEGCC